jgi:hypothetical protein
MSPVLENTRRVAEGAETDITDGGNVKEPKEVVALAQEAAKMETGRGAVSLKYPHRLAKSVGLPIVNGRPGLTQVHCSLAMVTPSPRSRGTYGVASTSGIRRGLADRAVVNRYLPDMLLGERMVAKVALSGTHDVKATCVTRLWYWTRTATLALPLPPHARMAVQDSTARALVSRLLHVAATGPNECMTTPTATT